MDYLAKFWRGCSGWPVLLAAMLLVVAIAPTVTTQARAQGIQEPGTLSGSEKNDVINAFCTKGAKANIKGVSDLLGSVEAGAIEPAWGVTILEAIMDRALICKDGTALIKTDNETLLALTLVPSALEPGKKKGAFVNLRLRGHLEMGTALLRLLSAPGGPDAAADVSALQKRAKIAPPILIERAARLPENAAFAKELESILAISGLQDPDPERRINAIERLAEAPSERNLTLLLDLRATLEGSDDVDAHSDVLKALDESLGTIRFWQRFGTVSATVYSGLSYASILFMAALGLSVIFGLMGVINLAQGELIMIGGYVTFLVQEVMKAVLPSYIDFYLFVAIPFAFLATAGVGVAMEASVIRHLYRRPLMTLLATWAISLFLINAVRVVFGTQNLEFFVPAFLNGGVTLFADFIVTWNRLFAICFAIAILLLALFVLRYTRLGMFIRAVTENRDMAGCVGVSVRRVDMLAFGIGSGLAGVAGLALSPIYTVNPGMGASFIVDAFMIVVLGGVGSIVGTAIAALGIGMINVVIEPLYGAVAAKVIVLLMIILFIQFRPEGLVAPKGRR